MKTYTEEEVRQLMKEQAKIVRHAAAAECQEMKRLLSGMQSGIIAGKLAKDIAGLNHTWAIDMEEE
jgi:hypothetical protein